MKKLICLLLTLVLLIGLAPTAFAIQGSEENSKVVASYRTGTSLYSFIRFDGKVPSTMSLGGESGTLFSGITPQKCGKEYPIELFILIDADSQVKLHENEMLTFLKALMDKKPGKLSVSVATQDQEFTVLQEKITDWATLEGVLKGISYDNWKSDPCGGLESVLKHMDTKTYTNGEMLNVLVITEGDAHFDSDDQDNNFAKRSESATKAKNAIATHPHVIVHSVLFGNGQRTVKEALDKGSGQHLSITADLTAEANAQTLAAYLGGFHAVKIASPDVAAMSLTNLVFRYSTTVDGVIQTHNLDLGSVADLGQPVQPAVTEPAETEAPEETTAPVVEETTAPDEEETTAPETDETTESTTAPTDSTVENPDETTGTEGTEPVIDDPEPKPDGIAWYIWVAVGVAALVLLVVIVLLVMRKKNNGAIAMRVTVEYGTAYVKEWYHLNESLIIGSGKKCDIVIPGSMVSKKHARIYQENGQIFVEDLGSASGTLLGGMKLHAPNRLRSGDLITVGNTSIRFLF